MENYDIYLEDFIRREFDEDEEQEQEEDIDIRKEVRGFEK